jgi:hypothetical protein
MTPAKLTPPPQSATANGTLPMLPTKLMTAIATPMIAFPALTSTPSPCKNSAFQTDCGTNTMTNPEMRKPTMTSV